MPKFPPTRRRPAVVTGASSGIGRATATALAALGHPVVLGARRVVECEDAAAAIRADGGEAVAIHLDLADGDSVERFAAGGRRHPRRGRDRRVQRRTRTWPAPCSTPSPPTLEGVLAVNITGTHRLVRALLPGHGRPAPGRRRVRHLRRGRAAPARHGRLRDLEVGPRGLRPLAPDGARGNRRAGHHPAARPHPDRHGHGLGPGGDRRDHRAVGGVGVRPPRQLHAPRRRGPGRLRRGRPSPGRPRHRHRTAARGADRAAGRRTKEASDGRRHRNSASPPGSREAKGPPATWRSCGSTRSASWSGSAPSAATSGSSASPTATSSCSAGPRPTSSSSGPPRRSSTRPRPTRS